jgi:membrane dipeptidase
MKRIGMQAVIGFMMVTMAGAAEPPRPTVTEEQVRRVHREAIVVDTHADTLWRVLDRGDDISVRSGKGHIDIPRLIEGGVDAEFFAIWVQPAYAPDHAATRALRLIDALHQVIEKSPDRMVLARSPSEIRAAAAAGKVAALLGIEGGQAIENDLALLRMFHRLGVRYMTLTWSFSLDWADSSGGSSQWRGLNDFGVKVVKEMNRLGMLVDISHVSDETFRDAMKVTKSPVIASHSSCRAICDAPRNMTDDMLRAMRDNGGVVMINFYSAFLDQKFRDRSKVVAESFKPRLSEIGGRYLLDPVGREDALWALHRDIDGSIPPPPFERLIEHIEHVIEVAGIDHVGLGSDFDGVTSLPVGMEDVTKLPSITRALLERGHSESDVKKVLGGNFIRVFDEVVRRSEDGSDPGSRNSKTSR